MKRWILLLCVLMLMGGCDMQKKGVKHNLEQSLQLSDNIRVTAELPVDYPEELNVYKAKWVQKSETQLIKVLMRNEAESVSEIQDQRIYHSEDNVIREHLALYEGKHEGHFISYGYRRKQRGRIQDELDALNFTMLEVRSIQPDWDWKSCALKIWWM